ncbi:hypothetical protein [Ehrlichia ruminantium]|uniref:hypothetical protein n=1 Tax=Ehrlichia ruminantium TaxID=779 RepID=UPI0015DC4A3E|nr:hypothetical protein [Ehrlichia ruminantium]QLK57470.1 hypothetical protein FDZ59_00280 [Ehrlichia ruminantium]
MESIKKTSSNDEISKSDKTKKSVTRKRNTYNTSTQRTTAKANKSVADDKSQDMQENIESINLKSTESSNEVIYDTKLNNETSETKQHGFLKDLWYSLREYFS